MSQWIVQLDPVAIAPDRTVLDLNSGAIACGSIDWGDAEVTAYETQEGQFGNTVADMILPNRTITINLLLGADDGHAGVTEEAARAKLQQKVALLQREGGQILRQRNGGPAMYADIVKAQVTIPDAWGETGGIEADVVLVLETLPDFYGDEVTLDTLTGTGRINSVLKQSTVTAAIAGDYPARCRIIVADTSGNDQHGLVWGLRSRHYDPAATAALAYEAEALTAVNGAASAVLAGASGGSVVTISSLPAAAWVSFLTTQFSGGGSQLTHTGSYRVWARVYSSTGTPQLRLQWGAGSLSVPVTNDAVIIPGSGGFYLVDFGSVRLDAPPTGTNAWFGAVQAFSAAGGDSASIDCLYFEPLDEAAGQLASTSVPPASSVQSQASPGTAANDAGVGTVAWTAAPTTSTCAFATAGQASEYLKLTNFGFAIPSGATIIGIMASLTRQASPSGGSVHDNQIRLVKAGTVQATNKTVPGSWITSPTVATYGGSSDLWSTTWTPADINNSGFGIAISAINSFTASITASVSSVTITVYYTLASGFTIAQDAVVYASKTAELRSDGMFRTQDGSVYGAVSQVIGDLPRLPPSGIENRAVQIFAKPSRGDLGTLSDGGLDAFTVQVKYRPCYLSRP